MSALPSYLSSGASSRAHHAFLVKLHRAQSDQEEDEVIRDEVHRRHQELAANGGASLGVLTDTLIILLHCTIYQHRSGIFDGNGVGAQDGETREDRPSKRGIGEDWAFMAALQVIERSTDVRQKRTGYLYLAERMPQNHELRLMLINTIRKDLESKVTSHILLALGAIIKQPSDDLVPAVTPLLTTKAFLKHTEPAIRQRSLQGLIALHLLMPATAIRGERVFPLSMSKVVRLLSSEEDLGVLCVLLQLLSKLLDSGAHQIQTTPERIYLVQQISLVMGRLQPDSHVAIAAVVSIRSVLSAGTITSPSATDDDDMRIAAEDLDEALGRMILRTEDVGALSSAFTMEICSLFQPSVIGAVELPTTLRRCLELLSQVLCPPSSSSGSALPAPNDHVFVLGCLYMIPLDKREQELGADEMGTIMRGLESGDDSVRKATLRLLQHSAPEVLDQTFHSYIQALQQRSDLALPPQLPPSLDQEKKLRLAINETATRALEIVYICEGGHGEGSRAADRVYAVLEAMRASEQEGVMMANDVVWAEGLQTLDTSLLSQTSSYASNFGITLIQFPSSSNSTLLALRSTAARDYLSDDVDIDVVTRALLSDLEIAQNGQRQEDTLSAIIHVLSSSVLGSGTATRQAQEGLGRILRENKLSKRVRQLITVTLDLLNAGVWREVEAELTTDRRTVEHILHAVEVVHSRHRAELEYDDPSNSVHTLRSPHTAPPREMGAKSSLRYGAYDPPPVKARPGPAAHS